MLGSLLANGSMSRLIIAALLGIATIVILITACKVHAFLSLMFGSVLMALVAGVPLANCFDSFTKGLGSTVGDVGILIVLGAMIGALLVESGGADTIVDAIVAKAPGNRLPWAIALISFIMGISLFFEVGVVLMIPVIMSLAKRKNQPAILLGIPAFAALGCLHGFVPPHPGPLIAVSALNANLGLTLGLGLLIAIPTTVCAGPLVAPWMARQVPVKANDLYASEEKKVETKNRPRFGASLGVVLLPVLLMLLHAIFEMAGWIVPILSEAVAFFGKPIVALLVAVLYGTFALGMRGGRTLKEVGAIIGGSFTSIAGILLIVGAGGGFKQTLIDSGIANLIGSWIASLPIPAFLAAWLVAVFIRLATGSATVSTITAAGLVAPLAASATPVEASLIVLAIGAGSMFLSHVNDGGFWMIKEYFGMTIGQTLKTWSLTATIISVVGLVLIMALHLILVV